MLSPAAGSSRGYVHGASDRTGASRRPPVTPGDILATMYRLLGIDPHMELYDRTNRPHRIVLKGEVVEELLA